MLTIGLTGGIASGKSTAARHLATLGAHVIDADRLGHRAYEPGSPGHAAVAEAFGIDVVADDGSIDRKALGAIVFGNPEALNRLTGIVWPEIRRLAEIEIDAARAASEVQVIVVEAAVLFEAGWESMADEVWVVVAEPAAAIARAVARDGVTEEAVRSRIAAQLGNDERRARAHRVIENNASEDALTAAVTSAWGELRARPLRTTGEDS